MPRWLTNTMIMGFLVAIVISLVVALLPLLRGGETGRKVVVALTWRIGLACALFLLLLLGLATGVITPHGLAPHPSGGSPTHHEQQHPR